LDVKHLVYDSTVFRHTPSRSNGKLPFSGGLGGIDFIFVAPKDILLFGFGVVYVAAWRNAPCAVKQLHIDGNNEAKVKEFFREAETMKNIRPHPKVVSMLGVCTNPKFPLCIVTEFLSGGSLYDFIHDSSTNLTGAQVSEMAADVAGGMAHLHAENFIHCDLACRNLLCVHERDRVNIKVADFGLSKLVVGGAYDASSDKKLPVRWSSPEVLQHGKLSRAGDVWSFGVVIYEMLEQAIPYAGMSNKEVVNFVCKKKGILPKPTRISYPQLLDDTMTSCMQFNPADRPTFSQIFASFGSLSQLLNQSTNTTTTTTATTATTATTNNGDYNYNQLGPASDTHYANRLVTEKPYGVASSATDDHYEIV